MPLKLAYILTAILYPALIFIGLKFFEPRIISLIFIAIAFFHFLSFKTQSKYPSYQKYGIMAIAILVAILTQISNQVLFIKIYPALVSIIFLIAFSSTLIKAPSMIERFARLYDKNLPQEAIPYTRKVTMVWCVFFVFNALISLYTTFYGSMELWTLYNGLISYLLMGALFAIEYLTRKIVIKKQNRQ